MKYLIKYFIDFTVLVFLYAFVFFKRWKAQGRGSLLVNTLMYAYISLVLYFTMMPVVVSIPSMLDHPYKSMNLVPFIDVSLGRGDFLRQVFLMVSQVCLYRKVRRNADFFLCPKTKREDK